MTDYTIITDSSCDLPAELAQELELVVMPLSVTLDEKTYVNYLDEREISTADFYAALRQGKPAATTGVNLNQALEAMTAELESGRDILCLSFSSGLSCTYSSASTAAAELAEKYPQRKIFVVDTLCASMGEGLLVYLTAMEKAKGKSIEEARDFAESTKMSLCHWFTVDDLHHLKRGGRISSATAVMGTLLGIKPVLHTDDQGKLANVDTVRGRKNSILALADKMEASAIDPASQTVFISHGDCADEAKLLADTVKKRMGVKDVRISFIGPVIGGHSGPGTVALFFIGKQR